MNAARWLAVALLCAACSDRSGARSQVTSPPREMNGSGTGDHEDLDPLDSWLGPGRDVRRLSIDQVSASFATVLGQPWTVNTPDGYRYPIEVVYGALGQPDYLRRLSEDLEPHLLFAKFVNEGAYAACGDAVEVDLTVPRNERHVMRKVEPAQTVAQDRAAILANLRDMRLRFHGARVDPHDEESVKPWLELFTAVSGLQGHGPIDGWRAVCVAMVADPEFALN